MTLNINQTVSIMYNSVNLQQPDFEFVPLFPLTYITVNRVYREPERENTVARRRILNK